jgi:hypothetical protein
MDQPNPLPSSVMVYGSLCPTVYGGQVQGMAEQRASLTNKD